jgi:acetyl-CoA acetyltransferase
LISEGRTRLDGDIPVNPSGGLHAKGHPIGTTGIGQIVEIYEQYWGESGAVQVNEPTVGLQHNLVSGETGPGR